MIDERFDAKCCDLGCSCPNCFNLGGYCPKCGNCGLGCYCPNCFNLGGLCPKCCDLGGLCPKIVRLVVAIVRVGARETLCVVAVCCELELRSYLACPRSAMRLHHLSIRYQKRTCKAAGLASLLLETVHS